MHRLQNLGRNPRKTNGISNPHTPLYIGRFAPSPTGPLHLGSLFTALASYLDARANRGQWLLRIDDLDTPRNRKGAADSILSTLENFELHWDGAADFQNRHLEFYQHELEKLWQKDGLYACTCSRKTLSDYPQTGIYPGLCRTMPPSAQTPSALRVKTGHTLIAFNDRLQGKLSRNLATQDGDFIVKRKDGIFAYPFSVVVDDYRQGVTAVVRGFDLFYETPKQIFLQHQLNYPQPSYLHIPVIVDTHGQKLSKQTFAKPVIAENKRMVIFELLHLLGQKPPEALKTLPVSQQLEWACTNWTPSALTGQQQLSQYHHQELPITT